MYIHGLKNFFYNLALVKVVLFSGCKCYLNTGSIVLIDMLVFDTGFFLKVVIWFELTFNNCKYICTPRSVLCVCFLFLIGFV